MKKRLLWPLLAVLLCFALSACSRDGGQGQQLTPGPDQVSRVVKVVNTHENSVLAVDWDDGEYTLELCSVGMRDSAIVDENGKSISAADLRSGMILEVIWDGMVAESWPCQIWVESVRVVEQDDDLVGLYRQVISDLWETDSGLNHGVEMLGFDFSALTNLTEQERIALEYLASCDLGLGLQYAVGTWEELCDQGYIDRENLYWENGVFFSLEIAKAPGKASFVFSAEKWRSGLGAIFYTDCTAKRGADGQWSYEPGGFAIA